MQVTELALYDVTESCPIQFLLHSSVVSLVNLHVNIKTLVYCANVTLLVKWASECIDCAFHTVYRWNTWNITTAQTVWGEPELNHSLYRLLQPRPHWKWVCVFVYRKLLSLLQTANLLPYAPLTVRNQNSISDRIGEKTLREIRLSRGASSPLARRTSSLIPGCNKVRLCRGLIWFPWSCADGYLGGVIFAGVCLWAHQAVLVSADIQAVDVVSRCWSSTIWTGYRLDLGGYGDLGIRTEQTNICIDVIPFKK